MAELQAVQDHVVMPLSWWFAGNVAWQTDHGDVPTNRDWLLVGTNRFFGIFRGVPKTMERVKRIGGVLSSWMRETHL